MDLVAESISQTGLKTKEKIEEAEGGILFVEEAYRLMVLGSRTDFGGEALEEVMSAMDSGKLLVILSGYVEPMKLVFDSNEVFLRRVTTHFVFEYFSCEELAQILHMKAASSGTNVDDSIYYRFDLCNSCSTTAITELIERETSSEQQSMMNGGLIDQVLVKAKDSLDLRLDYGCEEYQQLTTFTFEDLKASFSLLKANHIWMDSKRRPLWFPEVGNRRRRRKGRGMLMRRINVVTMVATILIVGLIFLIVFANTRICDHV